jgi:protein arginine kinase activator
MSKVIDSMQELPERHLECSECKKPIAVCYTEIVGKMIYKLGMCADCPLLRQKLYGTPTGAVNEEAKTAGLTCGSCGTTADEVKMGSLLGCSLCYAVFEETILQELQAANRLANKGILTKPTKLIHLGKTPGQAVEVTPATKLIQLHQALHDTLAKEDYEQAAWLRDQIKALTEEKKKHDK